MYIQEAHKLRVTNSSKISHSLAIETTTVNLCLEIMPHDSKPSARSLET